MTWLRSLIAGVAILAAPFAFADVPDAARTADVVILGEIHDNPAHHDTQTVYINALSPKAVVFEMLSPAEADAITSDISALSQAEWSNIEDYRAVISASARIVGAALPRDVVRAAFASGAASQFGGNAAAFGLTQPLPEDEQKTREEAQFLAHCEAMPRDMMSGMVEAQRLRDAHFARVVLDALGTYGAPVILITGNGHARSDWGVPAYLATVRPGLSVFTLGQSEAGQISGAFDSVLDAAAVDRPDPCAAFR